MNIFRYIYLKCKPKSSLSADEILELLRYRYNKQSTKYCYTWQSWMPQYLKNNPELLQDYIIECNIKIDNIVYEEEMEDWDNRFNALNAVKYVTPEQIAREKELVQGYKFGDADGPVFVCPTFRTTSGGGPG